MPYLFLLFSAVKVFIFHKLLLEWRLYASTPHVTWMDHTKLAWLMWQALYTPGSKNKHISIKKFQQQKVLLILFTNNKR